MKNADKIITLYNYFTDAETGYDTCQRLQIDGVAAFVQTQVNVSEEGLASASVYTVRIPETSTKAQYVTPKQFVELPDKNGYFTLSKGDKIVLGLAEEDTATAAYLENKYGNDQVMTITGVTDNRDKRQPHWKVVGE